MVKQPRLNTNKNNQRLNLQLVLLYNKWHQFLGISYWSKSEYWSQKRSQNGNIHSTKLDVYAEKQSESNLSFISLTPKQGRKYHALAYSPSQLVRTGTIHKEV